MRRTLLPMLVVAACGGGGTPSPTHGGGTNVVAAAPIDAAPALPRIAELSPPGFEGMYLGMPRAAFVAWAAQHDRQIVALPDYPPSSSDGPRTTWEENRYDGTVGNVHYHFLAEGDEPLYLVEINYQDPQAPYDLVEQRYAKLGRATTSGASSDVLLEGYGDRPVMIWALGRLYMQVK